MIFVQCLSLLLRNTRPYKTPWTWSGTWGQKQRTLPEQWVSYISSPTLCLLIVITLLCPLQQCGLTFLDSFLVVLSSDGGGARDAEETESDPDAGLLTLPSSTGSPQPGHHTDPGSGDTEDGAPEPGLWTQLIHKHDSFMTSHSLFEFMEKHCPL